MYGSVQERERGRERGRGERLVYNLKEKSFSLNEWSVHWVHSMYKIKIN